MKNIPFWKLESKVSSKALLPTPNAKKAHQISFINKSKQTRFNIWDLKIIQIRTKTTNHICCCPCIIAK
jgi:hypothetical protein